MVDRAKIIGRLKQLGYVATEADHEQIEYELQLVTDYVKNYCNITTIPDILDYRIVERVCGAFLFNKKNTGSLRGFDYDTVVKELKEGDTTVKYAVGQGEDTPENRFDTVVKAMERGFDKWITPYRRLRWD